MEMLKIIALNCLFVNLVNFLLEDTKGEDPP